VSRTAAAAAVSRTAAAVQQGIRPNWIWHYHALPRITTHYHALPPIATHCHPLSKKKKASTTHYPIKSDAPVSRERARPQPPAASRRCGYGGSGGGGRGQPRRRPGSPARAPATEPSGPGAKLPPPDHGPRTTPTPSTQPSSPAQQLLTPHWIQGANGGQYRRSPPLAPLIARLIKGGVAAPARGPWGVCGCGCWQLATSNKPAGLRAHAAP
jgi:hypothetical protein